METFTKAHQRLPELGGGLRPQPQGSDGMGRKGVHKEDHVLPALRRMEKKDAFGVYFIFLTGQSLDDAQSSV